MFPMTFLFLGGRLAVDLLNTVIARDLLGRREDVAAWGAAAGVVSRRELWRGGREPADLQAFREALRRGLVAWAVAGTPPARVIALLNHHLARDPAVTEVSRKGRDRKSTRLNSSHGYISYAVFCLKKKNNFPLSLSIRTLTPQASNSMH